MRIIGKKWSVGRKEGRMESVGWNVVLGTKIGMRRKDGRMRSMGNKGAWVG